MNVKKCDACGRPANKKFGACGVVNYCSASHQRLFWPTHRLNCGLDKESHWIVQPYLNSEETKALEHIKHIGGGNDLLGSNPTVAVVVTLYLILSASHWIKCNGRTRSSF